MVSICDRYRSLMKYSPDAMVVLDQSGTMIEVNPALEKMTGFRAADLLGQPFHCLIAIQQLDTVTKHFVYALRGEVQQYDTVAFSRSGQNIDLSVQYIPIYDDHGVANVMGIARDITVQKRTERSLKQMAYYDYLTGLPNRYLLQERTEEALREADRTGSLCALLFVDCDYFKKVNDCFGHVAGDEVLKAFTRRLQSILRDVDTIARVGGDEFVILLPGIHQQADGLAVASRINEALRKPIEIKANVSWNIRSSIGISFYPDDGRDVDTLIKRADDSMYEEKRNKICIKNNDIERKL